MTFLRILGALLSGCLALFLVVLVSRISWALLVLLQRASKLRQADSEAVGFHYNRFGLSMGAVRLEGWQLFLSLGVLSVIAFALAYACIILLSGQRVQVSVLTIETK
jgi:hypothetical protein